MHPVLLLIVLAGVAFIGYLSGQAHSRSGKILEDAARIMLPEPFQGVAKGALKSFVYLFGALLGIFFILTAFEEGPQFFLPFVLISLWLLAPVWVYLDAKERGGRARAWALLSLFIPMGILGYLITRPEKPRACSRCGFRMRSDFTVCPYCGPQAGRLCPDCSNAAEPDWVYCPYCQSSLSPGAGSGPLEFRSGPFSGAPAPLPEFPSSEF